MSRRVPYAEPVILRDSGPEEWDSIVEADAPTKNLKPWRGDLRHTVAYRWEVALFAAMPLLYWVGSPSLETLGVSVAGIVVLWAAWLIGSALVRLQSLSHHRVVHTVHRPDHGRCDEEHRLELTLPAGRRLGFVRVLVLEQITTTGSNGGTYRSTHRRAAWRYEPPLEGPQATVQFPLDRVFEDHIGRSPGQRRAEFVVAIDLGFFEPGQPVLAVPARWWRHTRTLSPPAKNTWGRSREEQREQRRLYEWPLWGLTGGRGGRARKGTGRQHLRWIEAWCGGQPVPDGKDLWTTEELPGYHMP